MQSLRDGPLQSRLWLLHRVRQQLAASEPRRLKKWIREIVARQPRALDVISFFKLAGCSSFDRRKQPSSISRVFISATYLKRAFFCRRMVQSNVMPSQSPVNASVSRLQDYFGLASRSQVWIAAGLLCLGTFFKFWNVFFFRFNSDEPQHLHVVWAWTHGLVQYRDVFDNHMPLFQLLCAPILGLLGEHAADLYWMRLLMVPLYFLSLWCVYRIGTIAFSRRVGLWAALLASGMGAYHFCSTEFRTDNVWTPL